MIFPSGSSEETMQYPKGLETLSSYRMIGNGNLYWSSHTPEEATQANEHKISETIFIYEDIIGENNSNRYEQCC